jgi:hypothetical protein
MELVELLEKKRGTQTNKQFAADLGISERMWSSLKSGQRRIGGKTLMGILDKYGKKDKELTNAVWDYIDSYPIKNIRSK